MFTRQRILIALFLLTCMAMAGYYWVNTSRIQDSNLSMTCRGQLCHFQVDLENPAQLQAVQLIWVAHQVNQNRGSLFSFIDKRAIEVEGQEVYMLAGSKRRISGSFYKPPRTGYVVLKLRPLSVD